jgi:hypothetical protein
MTAVWLLSRVGRSAVAPQETPVRLVLLVLLVEIRSGRSVLASFQTAASLLPHDDELGRVARVAMVSGLMTSIQHAGPRLRPVVAQLARAQRSGSTLSGTVRRLIDEGLADERARRLARARALPTRLMIPVTLLMLPGLILLLYAPSLAGIYQDLLGQWS